MIHVFMTYRQEIEADVYDRVHASFMHGLTTARGCTKAEEMLYHTRQYDYSYDACGSWPPATGVRIKTCRAVLYFFVSSLWKPRLRESVWGRTSVRSFYILIPPTR